MSHAEHPCRVRSTLPSRLAQLPRSPATLPAQYPAGSGVGVSVLLRQPHGFEGLGLGRKYPKPPEPAIAHCPDMPNAFFDRDSALPAQRPNVEGRDYVLSCVDPFLRVS